MKPEGEFNDPCLLYTVKKLRTIIEIIYLYENVLVIYAPLFLDKL